MREGFLYLFSAIIFAFIGNIMIKKSQGFSLVKESILSCLFFFLGLFYLSKSHVLLPFGILTLTYSVVLIVLNRLLSIFYFKDSFNIFSIIGIILILSGISLVYMIGNEL